jgi:uncharacterized membrane protein
MTESTKPSNFFGTERLVMLSDGVYAIAITLLVLDLRLPELPTDVSAQAYDAALLDLFPRFFSYVLSFAVIGLFWMAHHRLFRFLKRADGRLSALNLLSLAGVSFIPFPTSLLGQYTSQRTTLVIYALTMAVVGLAYTLMWVYARRRHLLDESLDRQTIRLYTLWPLVTVCVFALSIPVAYLNVSVAMTMWWLILIARLVFSRWL